MSRKLSLLLILVLILTAILTGCQTSAQSNIQVVDADNTFVVLMEMNNYPEGYSDLPMDFKNSKDLESLFKSLSVPDENILMKLDEMEVEDVSETFDWIDERANENSFVFYYVGAHGTYLREGISWNDFVPTLWSNLKQTDKVMVVDSCNAGLLVSNFKEDTYSGITYGVVSDDELNWWGVEEENLPIIGSIWLHYFLDAINNPRPDIDLNKDKGISFMEAQAYSNINAQLYMSEYVFSIPEYLKGYENHGTYPTRKDAYPNAQFYNHLDHEIILTSYTD